MSSSFRLRKRREIPQYYNLGFPYDEKVIFDGITPSSMNGIEDHYVRPQGECHPDFVAHPIGRPDGVKLCIRRLTPEKTRIDEPNDKKLLDELHLHTGYRRSSPTLYPILGKDQTIIWPENPTQINNPQLFQDRRRPYEQTLIREDYYRLPVKYNATGLNPTKTPDGPFYDYPLMSRVNDLYSNEWQPRTSGEQNANIPQYKYDVTRLVQPYPLYKDQKVTSPDYNPNRDPEMLEYQDKNNYTRVV